MSSDPLSAEGRIAGLYIVSLTNDAPISVNANDPRIASKCVTVTRLNCKFGRTVHLTRRSHSYARIFGPSNVTFVPIAEVEELHRAERAVLQQLDRFRLRGPTRRKNEWLSGITPAEVEDIVFSTLDREGIAYRRMRTVLSSSNSSVPTVRG